MLCCLLTNSRQNDFFLSAVYKWADDSKSRWETSDFQKRLNSSPKSTPVIVSVDMNSPPKHLNTLCSSDNNEQLLSFLFDHHYLRQVVDFPTCADNTINLFFHRKCGNLVQIEKDFTKVYSITNH